MQNQLKSSENTAATATSL